jgi:hypothetical protein
MIKEHGDISLFSMQGLEKLNDMTTISYFSASNKHKDYLIQLIKKRNRMEFMQNSSEMNYFSSTTSLDDSEDGEEFHLEMENDDDAF